MKKIIFIITLFISSISFSQRNSFEKILFGNWKTTSVYFDNKFYHDFKHDSLIIYDTQALLLIKEDVNIDNRVISATKKYTTAFSSTYQFNTDSTCTEVLRDGRLIKYSVKPDEVNQMFFFESIDDKVSSFKVSIMTINRNVLVLKFLFKNSEGYTALVERVN